MLALSNLVLAAGLLLAAGASAVAALTASALLGPAQVAARLFEFMAARRFGFPPLQSARLATAMHPLGGLVLGVFGGLPLAASSFAVLHGAGNGMISIAKGTLPLAIFGPAGYGYRQGLLSVPARAMQALAPFAFGLVLDIQGARAAIVLSSGLSLVALGALMALRQESAAIRTTPRCSSIGGAARFPFTSMGPTSQWTIGVASGRSTESDPFDFLPAT